MRKLIVAGIITCFLLGTWTCYMQYDTKKFIEELSQEPLPEQRKNNTVQDSREPHADGVGKITQTEHENISNSPEETLQDGAQPNEIGAVTGSEVDALDPDQTPDNITTTLSPELEELFTRFHPLHQRSLEASEEHRLIMVRVLSVSRRRRTIGQDLASARDEATKRKVLSEWKKLDKWVEEHKPVIMALQDEMKQLASDRLRLLKKYGFSSEASFFWIHEKSYQEAYNTWSSGQ